jgi:site-specific DNA-methyltransferase (adenine-specific)
MDGPAFNRVYASDCLQTMQQWPDGCVDHCIADPPFGIASGKGRRARRGLSWAFSSHVTMQEAWDRFSDDDYFRFSLEWLRQVCRVVKPNGNILVFGTYHSVYLLGFLLGHVLNRRILNSVIWYKPNAQPNVTARMLTESTEQIVWAVNGTPKQATGWIFNYWDAKELNGGRQMRNMWEFPVTPKRERLDGGHPSQKPVGLLERAVLLATRPGDIILDPFGGAGTLAIAAARHGRQWVLIEREPEYAALAARRLAAESEAG